MIFRKSVYLKTVFVIFGLLMVLVQTGCWDYRETEDRGYVLGIAIDIAKPIHKGQDDLVEHLSKRDIEKMPVQEGSPKYEYTIQIPIIPQARIKPEGGGGGSVHEDRAWNITIAGNSFFEVNREFATRLDYPAFYEHLQVVVISEEVARDGIFETLDFLIRDHEIRRRTRVFITPGEAKAVLDVIPRIEDYSSLYLVKLPKGAEKTSRIAHLTDLGVVSQNTHSNLDFTLPRVVATKDEIKDAGVAVFSDSNMVGWLGEIDTIWLKWIRDAAIGGLVVVDSPNEDGQLLAIEIIRVKTKVRPSIVDDEIIMNIDVNGTFNLVEEMRIGESNVFDEKYIEEAERLIREKIEREIKDTVSYVQEEFGVDIFHFELALKRYAPREWEKYEQEWHEIFPNVEVNVSVDARIRLVGLVR